MFPNTARKLVQSALGLSLATLPAHAEVFVWEMQATEAQVNNAGTVDGSTDSAATGMAALSFDTDTRELDYDVSWNMLEQNLSKIHIHGPTEPSASNPTHLWDIFPDLDANDPPPPPGLDRISDSVQDVVSFEQIVNETSLPPVDPGVALAIMLQESVEQPGVGRAYVNIHSQAWQMGEIRANFVLTQGVPPVSTKGSASCIDRQQKSLGKVTKKRAAQLRGCVKKGAGAKLAGTIEACLAEDPLPRSVDKAVAKADRDFEKRCEGFDKDGLPRFPVFGAGDPVFGAPDTNVASASGVEAPLGLVRRMFGPDLDAAILLKSADKAGATCQQKLLATAAKCQDTAVSIYASCARSGLKGGTAASRADLEACVAPDAKGKLSKACDAKVAADVSKRCAGLDLAATFRGLVDASANGIAAAARCQACLSLNRTGGLAADCDAFDDGDGANTTCVPMS